MGGWVGGGWSVGRLWVGVWLWVVGGWVLVVGCGLWVVAVGCGGWAVRCQKRSARAFQCESAGTSVSPATQTENNYLTNAFMVT